jgi:hypothetical protein
MRVAALLALALVLAGCGGATKTMTVTVTRTVTTATGPKTPPAAEAQTASVKYFGTPVSVTRLDAKRYALTIKPALFLVGVTANVAFAAGQQNACQPLECAPVDDDRWVLPAGSQNLLFILPAKAKGTVLDPRNNPIRVTAAQLKALIGGAKTPKLSEPLAAGGLWVTVDVDTVTSFAQQFQP